MVVAYAGFLLVLALVVVTIYLVGVAYAAAKLDERNDR